MSIKSKDQFLNHKNNITNQFKDHLGFLLGYLEQVNSKPSEAEIFLIKKAIWKLHDNVLNTIGDSNNEENK
jgi:hypothetical protein